MSKHYLRMPVGFGPFPGPRQLPDSRQRDPVNSPHRTVASVTCETEPSAITPLLPPGFSLIDPSFTVEVQHLEKIDWLAGRSYSTLGVKFPVQFEGSVDCVKGDFLAVLWENLADPIISGREELGYAKLWCAIDETIRIADRRRFVAHWLGHQFFTMELHNLQTATGLPALRKPMPHYKYIPKTGLPGQADMACATMTPADNPHLTIDSRLIGEGEIKFINSTWEELPTLFHIVNPLSELPILRVKSATLTFSHGGKDLADQRYLH